MLLDSNTKKVIALLDMFDKTGRIDMDGLKIIMGHVSTSTTMLYVHLVQSFLVCRNSPSHLDKILGTAL